jgi:hypothetical protein
MMCIHFRAEEEFAIYGLLLISSHQSSFLSLIGNLCFTGVLQECGTRSLGPEKITLLHINKQTMTERDLSMYPLNQQSSITVLFAYLHHSCLTATYHAPCQNKIFYFLSCSCRLCVHVTIKGQDQSCVYWTPFSAKPSPLLFFILKVSLFFD